jgi:SAM-dependent methyltransferase
VSEDFDASAYGKFIAADYDDVYAKLSWTDEVDTILRLADGGSVLELGIGSGRVALPLRERGVEVHGIEGSEEMVQRLHAKPGGADIPVTVGDFSSTELGRTFDVVFLTFNTIFALPSQDAQVDCFRNAARHLDAGGVFVIQAWIPDVGAFRNGRAMRPYEMSEGRVVMEVAELHPAEQRMETNKIFFDEKGARTFPANHRYAWPSELDLMARLAGMRLDQRWEDWSRAPFGDRSMSHVSVWRKISADAW